MSADFADLPAVFSLARIAVATERQRVIGDRLTAPVSADSLFARVAVMVESALAKTGKRIDAMVADKQKELMTI